MRLNEEAERCLSLLEVPMIIPKLKLPGGQPTHRISVVVPIIKYRDGLERCLESVNVAASKVRNKESVDDLPDFKFFLKESLQARDYHEITRIRGIAEQYGFTLTSAYYRPCMADSWNDAVELVSGGEYVHLLADDDWLRPEFYEKIWPHLLDGCLAVSTGYEREEGGLVTLEHRIDKQGDGSGMLARLERGNCMVPSATVISREAYRAVGGYVEGLVHDWDLYLRVAMHALERWNKRGTPWRVVPEYLVRQVVGDDSDGKQPGKTLELMHLLIKTVAVHETRRPGRMDARDVYSELMLAEAFGSGDHEMFDLSRKMKGAK